MLKHFFVRLLLPALMLTMVVASPVRAADNYWIDRAESGDARSQYNLARMYLWGMSELGIKQDNKEAYSWFLKAAEQGFAPAQFEVSVALRQGRGVIPDQKAADAWLNKARAQGYTGSESSMSRSTTVQQGANDTSIAPGDLWPLISNLNVDVVLNSITRVRFFSGWWTWWLGALGLGLVTVGFWYVNRVTLGVSSSWDRIVSWREDLKLAEADRLMRSTPVDDLAAALMAETVAEFGDEIPDSLKSDLSSGAQSGAQPVRVERTRWTVHVTFLVTLMTGGFLGYAPTGDWQVRTDMGPEFVKYFGSGPEAMFVLFVGGLLVGFGTRLGGGCTSGHALSGCSRLQTGSLVGTASFFGTAIIVSIMIKLFLG